MCSPRKFRAYYIDRTVAQETLLHHQELSLITLFGFEACNELLVSTNRLIGNWQVITPPSFRRARHCNCRVVDEFASGDGSVRYQIAKYLQ